MRVGKRFVLIGLLVAMVIAIADVLAYTYAYGSTESLFAHTYLADRWSVHEVVRLLPLAIYVAVVALHSSAIAKTGTPQTPSSEHR